MAQQGEAGPDNLPVFVGVAGRGQAAQSGELCLKPADTSQAVDEVSDSLFFSLAVGRKTVADIEGFAEGTILREQHLCQAEICLVRRL